MFLSSWRSPAGFPYDVNTARMTFSAACSQRKMGFLFGRDERTSTVEAQPGPDQVERTRETSIIRGSLPSYGS